MRAIIDTNVILDVFERREPFFSESAAVLQKSRTEYDGYILVSQLDDVHFLLHKKLRDNKIARYAVKDLSDDFNLIDLLPEDAHNAAHSDMNDYEDAVIAYRAKRFNADYIVTRNVKDFRKSPVKAITPTDFLVSLNQTANV